MRQAKDRYGPKPPTPSFLNLFAQGAKTESAMLMPSVREAREAQTASHLTRLGVRAPALAKVASVMEQNLETPLSMTEIGEKVGLSVRQVERLFLRYCSGAYRCSTGDGAELALDPE